MRTSGVDEAALDALSDAVLLAAQTLAQSTSEALETLAPDLNLTELRALTLLQVHGPLRLIDVADALDVTPTTATRLADRLTAGGVVERTRLSRDRREIHLAISAAGITLVAKVAARRRRYMTSLLRDVDPRAISSATDLLGALAGNGAAVASETA